MPNAQYQIEKDGGFLGMESRTNPVLLKEQYLQYSQNLRLERGVAQCRRGNKRMNNDAIDGNNLFASGRYVTQEGVEKIAIIASDGLFLYNPDADAFDAKVLFPTGRTVGNGDKVTVVQAVNKLYIHRGLPVGIRKYSKLVYTGHPSLTVTVTTYSDTGRTIVANHGLQTGDEVSITTATDAHFNGSWVVTRVSNSVFTYQMLTTHPSKTQDCLSQKAKCALVYDGSTITAVPQGVDQGTTANMPPTDTAIYQSNRMVVKVNRDSLAVSDFLDFNTFDLTYGQFTINLGSYDELVGFTPWLDNEFIIFQRNSIYKGRVVNEQFLIGESPDTQSYITSISNSFGCVGRRAMVNTGRYVFFLSDGGIYMLEPQLDLKTINTLDPVSAPINDQLLEYNRDYLDKAHGVFFDNRLYMALPVGNDINGNPHTRPNKVFIFNILNKAWESIDTFPTRAAGVPESWDFYVDDFAIVNYDNKKRLFAVNYGGGRAPYVNSGVTINPPVGGVYLCEETESGDETDRTGISVLPASLTEDDPATPEREYGFWLRPTANRLIPTDCRLVTRRFTFGTLFEKRFSSVQADMTFQTGGAVRTLVNVYNPDRILDADLYQTTPEPDVTRRISVAQRGYGIEAEFRILTGRPAIRGVAIDATLTGRNLVNKD
jgi:hypothetical protein